jgi:hypothetical protein
VIWAPCLAQTFTIFICFLLFVSVFVSVIFFCMDIIMESTWHVSGDDVIVPLIL